MIPSGHQLVLKAGTPVRIVREKAGNHTAEVFGNLVVLGPECSAALGKEAREEQMEIDDQLPFNEQVVAQLKRCYDPEIPVNIYDLGLIYHIYDLQNGILNIDMTLTSPTCGMGPFIIQEVEKKLMVLQGVEQVKVELKFDPPWQKHMMSTAAKMTLGVL